MENQTQTKVTKKKSKKKTSTRSSQQSQSQTQNQSQNQTTSQSSTEPGHGGTADPFANLKARAAQVESNQEGGGVPGLEGTVITPEDALEENRKAAKVLIETVVAALSMQYPQMAAIYTPDIIQEGASKLAPIMEKPYFKALFGNSAQSLSKVSDEMSAALFFGPLLLATVTVLWPEDGQPVESNSSQQSEKPAAFKEAEINAPSWAEAEKSTHASKRK